MKRIFAFGAIFAVLTDPVGKNSQTVNVPMAVKLDDLTVLVRSSQRLLHHNDIWLAPSSVLRGSTNNAI
jgi:hypothetical protein